MIDFFPWAFWGALFFFAAAVLFVRRTAPKGLFPTAAGRGPVLVLALLVLLTALGQIPTENGSVLRTILTEGFAVGRAEAGASLPFAVTDLRGAALVHAGTTVVSTPAVRIVIQTLVALIAGGVTSFVAWMLTAGWFGVKRGVGFAEGVRALGEANPWRGAMIAGTLFWMTTTWVLFLGRDWHLFGTSPSGADLFLEVLAHLSGPVTAGLVAGALGLLASRGGYLRRWAAAGFAAGVVLDGLLGMTGLAPAGLGALSAAGPAWGTAGAVAATLLLLALSVSAARGE